MSAAARTTDDWSQRWPALARAVGLGADERLLLALSGGADSVLLLHWLAAARPSACIRAAHVDHGLRGVESDGDALFTAELCRALGVPFVCLRAELEPGTNLEARARAERYRLLVSEAQASGHTTILTGHHSDDALETVLMRWVRGTELAGLRGPREKLVWRTAPGEPAVRVVRPLLTLRREEVRALLAARGLAWREDSSNADPRFTRNRARARFLPLLEDLGGPELIDELRAFSHAVEALESEFARATAHLAWRAAPYAVAARGAEERTLGGVLPRGELTPLARPLARRVLWRLLTDGVGVAPSSTVLERVLADLFAARNARVGLARGWTLLLRPRELVLLPPRRAQSALGTVAQQLLLPFPSTGPVRLPTPELALSVPGIVTLEDGRRLSAELSAPPPSTPPRRARLEAELDAAALEGPLTVRFPQPGDRFRALGAPGSKPLVRFLADRGVPREERAHVPLVTVGAEILWVAGFAPAEARRIQSHTRRRLRLTLHA
ncbi:MAG: tRNA lysidine(34) synthetase TilS [Planctomycetes bacterium]|nr:tRNA lysidine(34) synthetase TilS [Planctomycetota bacterium]